ncbi:hypothetical protein [Novacetimonas pomaceti]|uniref:Uncharacterized protein n=1 Tax=Novacetimonas pomaceti TaxID=2021998 RepID=A0A318Q9I7_9PROT|nr:hypothetical protein [Novacetimonas pomaceti]MBV1832564.1 hypothetical protein [Novacetimonas pomaceti]PYD48343.1 hypothetical protein C3920_05270 [Novacetimonas pomaceti]PYD75545.1 hypothetical protein CFR71_09140 [Novacetimonas pomaceti]
MVDVPRYAVLFRTHTWDSFVERQFFRLQSLIDQGDLFVVVNNTSGKTRIPDTLRVVGFQESDFGKMGLADGGEGNLMWYNVDYALYFFMNIYDDYDYYVLFEYDVRGNVNFDELIKKVHDNRSDLVGVTASGAFNKWWFFQSCVGVYEEKELVKTFLQIGIFSRRAVSLLLRRRLEMSAQFRSGMLMNWPHCEAFIPIEIRKAGYRFSDLSSYVNVNRYSHEPAHLEEDTNFLEENEIIHPVLDTKRYILSTIRYEGRPEKFFIPSSSFGKKLRRFPVSSYGVPLFHALKKRAKLLFSLLGEKIFSYRIGRFRKIKEEF